jgi:hypothetical protein
LFDDAFDAPGSLNNCELEFLAAGKCLSGIYRIKELAEFLAANYLSEPEFIELRELAEF